MKSRGVPTALLLAHLLISAVTLSLQLQLVGSSPGPTISVAPAEHFAVLNQTFQIHIEVSNASDVYGWGLKLRWNATLLDAVNVTEGDFLSRGGDTYFFSKINNTAGYMQVGCTLLGNVSGVDGQGSLALLHFYPETPGVCILDLFDTKLVNSQIQLTPHGTSDGIVRVPIPGDVNIDGVVDIFDAVTVALAFGAAPSDLNWNPDADVTGDDLIDIFDMVVVALRFGQTAWH